MPPELPIRCLVVDDEPRDRDIIRGYIEQVPTLTLASAFDNAIDALLFLQAQEADLIFLDIRLPRLAGTEFVKLLPQGPKVIFTTAHREYAFDGFELDIVDFLLKPVAFGRFLRSLTKAYPRLDTGSPPPLPILPPLRFIYLRCDRKMVKVNLDELDYIESARDYTKVFTREHCLITRQTISSIEAMLPAGAFVRVHRSFIVSRQSIQSYTHETVTVGKRELPIGKFYLQAFMNLMGRTRN